VYFDGNNTREATFNLVDGRFDGFDLTGKLSGPSGPTGSIKLSLTVDAKGFLLSGVTVPGVTGNPKDFRPGKVTPPAQPAPVSQTLQAQPGPNNLVSGSGYRTFGQPYSPPTMLGPGSDNGVNIPFNFAKTNLSVANIQTATLLVDVALPADDPTANVLVVLGQSQSRLTVNGTVGGRTTAQLVLYRSQISNTFYQGNKKLLTSLAASGLSGTVVTDGTVYSVGMKIDT
jgi:hypothetical protein